MSSLDDALKKANRGTDKVEIGSEPGDEEIETLTMADVIKKVEGIRYLVRGWIPYGMLTQLLGAAGGSKSAFAMYALVRPIILAQPWFNGLKGFRAPRFVLWCDTEGSAAINAQRILDWKLPASRIKVPFADDPLKPVNLTDADHLERIETLVNRYRIPLVVIDSLRGGHDSEENSSKMGPILRNLVGIAEHTQTAIVIIHHSRKLSEDEEMTSNSSRGSSAILAMVRAQLMLDRPDPKSPWTRLRMGKENLGLRPEPIGFRWAENGLEFGVAPRKPEKVTHRGNAVEWLKARMTPGEWYEARPIIDDAEKAGYPQTGSLQQARKELGIEMPDNIKKEQKKTMWRLPVPPQLSIYDPRD